VRQVFTSPSDRLLRVSTRIDPFRRRVWPSISRQTNDLLELSRERGFGFRVLGQAPLIKEELYTGDWWIRPIEKETYPIPDHAINKAMAVYQAGINPKGWLIAHEVPKMLVSGRTENPMPWWRRWLLGLTARPLLLIGAGVGVALVAPFVFGLLLQVAAGIVAALALPLALLGLAGAALADPVLIAVTEDDYWVEVDRWK
jgi:hypothetical protein